MTEENENAVCGRWAVDFLAGVAYQRALNVIKSDFSSYM